MRCLWAIAVSLLLVASVPMAAQRGGGHASAGGHGGFGGHAGGGFSGGHSFGGGHSYGSVHSGSSFAPRSYSRGFSGGRIASRSFNRGSNRDRRSGNRYTTRTFGLRNYCYGYNCGGYGGWGYPYLGGGVDPYWWWDDDSDNGYDPAAPYNYDDGLANQMQEQGIPLRPPDSGDPDYRARSTPPAQHQPSATAPSTVLIFRDQHKQEVQNYAVVGLTLFVLAPQRPERIPLSDLDLTATAQANDDRGVEFRLPGAGAGQ